MTLTRQNLHAGKTGNGGFKRAQVEALGLKWPVKKGWLSELIGKEVSDETYSAFMAARERPDKNPQPAPANAPQRSRNGRLRALEQWAEQVTEIIYENLGVHIPIP